MDIKTVARKARVSTATVSRTIHLDPAVSVKTALRVRAAIKALKYRPNVNARALVSGRSHILGLTISDISNPFFPELVKRFEEIAIQHGYEVIVTNTDYSPERMSLCVGRMLERKVDGVAMMTSEMDSALIAEISARGVPIVFLDVGTVQNRMSNIAVNYAAGIGEAVQHLVDLGHRDIGFIGGPLKLKSARIRRAAFLRALKRHDVPGDSAWIEEGDHKIAGGEAAMSRFLAGKVPTAILASNDLTAIGALRAIHRHGLVVPGDISLVGFDDIDFAQYTQPALTTVRLARSELALQAFNALHHVLTGNSSQGKRYTVGTHLVIRESTGTCRTKLLRPHPVPVTQMIKAL